MDPEDLPQCRYCLSATYDGKPDQGAFIRPCTCTTLVHRGCLERWRTEKASTIHALRCSECHTFYELDIDVSRIEVLFEALRWFARLIFVYGGWTMVIATSCTRFGLNRGTCAYVPLFDYCLAAMTMALIQLLRARRSPLPWYLDAERKYLWEEVTWLVVAAIWSAISIVAYDRLDVPPPEGPDWVSVSGALLAFVLMAVMRAAHDHVRGSVKDLSIPS